ncbi:MAG TPA: adenylate/guanylate cyclase domain-containing protein [Deltaproteobacteria bacterium]|nr:adenylate/guanylate cyclase domain-containing protein [Deltaproteobacteria bacterium]
MQAFFKRPDTWFVIAIFLLMIPVERWELFSFTENQLHGFRHLVRWSALPPSETGFPIDEIVIVDTDEEFFKEYGGWPLRRSDIGQIVTNLKELGAKVIALDMLIDFPNSYGDDPILAEHLENAENTMAAARIQFKDGQFQSITFPTEAIKDKTASGYTNHTNIGSMLSRLRFFPAIHQEHQLWPFAVKALAIAEGVEPKLEGQELVVGEYRVPLDHFDDLWVDYPLLPAGIPFLAKYAGLSAIEVLDLKDLDEDDIEELQDLIADKIVLVGDTSEVSHDIFETPVGEIYGVEFLANTISTIMNGAPIQPADSSWEVAILIVLMLLVLGLSQLPKLETLAFLAVLAAYIALAFYAYAYHGIAFSMSYALFALILSFVAINLYKFILERRQKAFIKGAFSQYLSPTVIDAIVKDPSKLTLGGERREMTAYFSDIQKFSTISESLTPEELVNLLNLYLTEMCDIISSYHGTVDKFEGDAIIAFWGAPLDQPDHAKLACFATLDMQKRLMEMRKQFREEERPQLFVRMGINSGPIVVGNMGSSQRMDYTIMGDAVNLAARLEGANKFYKTYTMISEFTYAQAGEFLDSRPTDIIRVVGRKTPVTVYEVLERKNQLSGDKALVVENYLLGYECYRNRDFAAATPLFEKALEIDEEDGPSAEYLKRCEAFKLQPPGKDWDGVHTLTEKG